MRALDSHAPNVMKFKLKRGSPANNAKRSNAKSAQKNMWAMHASVVKQQNVANPALMCHSANNATHHLS